MGELLKDIATIHSGIYAKPNAIGEIIYLQVKDFSESGQLTGLLQPELRLTGKTEKHLLKSEDVLFAAKGVKNMAIKFDKAYGLAVASSAFLVIRLKEDYRSNILPDFLVWAINHPGSQMYLKGNAKGSSLPSISKKVMENLEIRIPPLNTQKLILKITQLRNKEQQLKQEIENLREQQIQQLLMNSLNKP